MLSTSFGIQSAVMLHLVTSIIPDIPVIWIDTGYLPKETYVFAESLIVRLNLNIQIYSPNITAARIDALFGKMWESGDPDMHKKYGYLTKVEPMRRAMADLNGRVTLAGLRADQTSLRENMKIINRVGKPTSLEEWKICPILRWSEQDIDDYMKKVPHTIHTRFIRISVNIYISEHGVHCVISSYSLRVHCVVPMQLLD